MRLNTTTSMTLAALSLSLGLSACQTMGAQERGTATGAGIGAVAGAILSSATGGKAGTGAVVGGLAGAVIGNVWSKNMEEQKRAMEQATQDTGVQVTQTADNELKLHVPSDVSFDSGQATIKPELRQVLDSFAQGLTRQTNTMLRIVGHTDSSGSDRINDPLSLARADAVRSYLVDRGVSPARIETVGRGSREPVASNDSTQGRAQNRRVEMFLREPGQASS
jgi:outer membrane protein OmpA-like peptidoglycan-associated protein